ncbi:tumor protein p63-regulated gene 1-like protein [Anneissia japonica]|uniref:tumor protein p63-regulated gene 1-like protein n=1 Tax=Anneissia japonica TaxID=1529436 RepID=UPI0014258B4A|nr:tumor protein p63-regulated gene 1-like protein [Anneissia japonica]
MSNPGLGGVGLDDNLDDRNTQEVSFKGGKLSLADDVSTFRPNDPKDETIMNVDIPSIRRSNSVCGRPQTNPLPDTIQDCFFAGKKGRMEGAVNDCKQKVLDENDGKVQGVWLLTEIDHWDNEKEKLVMLTEKMLLIIKYDFVVERVKDHKKIMLNSIDTVQFGLFEYPDKTLVHPRDGFGLKLSWGNGQQPSLVQMWNPWSTSVPWMIFTSHPLQHSARDTKTYQIESFKNAVTQAIKAASGNNDLNVNDDPIRFTIHVGLGSAVYNQSRIGFSRERGGISF